MLGALSRTQRVLASLIAALAALGPLGVSACGAAPEGGDDARAHEAPAPAAHEEPADATAIPDIPGEEHGAAHDPFAPATRSLAATRDALLDSLPPDSGNDRCARWQALDDDARAVFLVLTDLLGHRTILADGSSALDHVSALHAIRGRQQDGCVRCCGDSAFNRLYLSVDDALAAALRDTGVPGWRPSTDLAGPHEPFTLSLETDTRLPRGQLHLFAADDDAVALGRAGVEHVVDARALELDIDFNLLHESAPLCSYGGEDGVAAYAEAFASRGTAAPVELLYTPSGC